MGVNNGKMLFNKNWIRTLKEWGWVYEKVL